MRQSPHWTSAWRDALEQGEQLERELAAQAAASGKEAEAAQDRLAADQLQAKFQSLAPAK